MVKGEDLIGARTLGSMYDNDCISLKDKDGNDYRISATQILEALQKFSFSERKARKHIYLSLI